MMISTRDASAAGTDLAAHDADGYIPSKEIEHRQDISEKYLEIVLKRFGPKQPAHRPARKKAADTV